MYSANKDDYQKHTNMSIRKLLVCLFSSDILSYSSRILVFVVLALYYLDIGLAA